MKFYSQIGQDSYYINNIINKKRKGRFLDIGAHDGISTSNTYTLENELEWTGICIEANPELANKCRINRPKSRVIEAVIWSREEELEFEYPDSGDTFLSRVADLSVNTNYFSSHFQNSIKKKIKAFPISFILGPGKHHFDYFSLDIEGAELEALKGIDWSNTSFDYIAIEFGHRQDFLNEIIDFMTNKGYFLHRINDFDVDFIR